MEPTSTTPEASNPNEASQPTARLAVAGNPNELIYFQEQAPTEAPPKKVKWEPAGNMAKAFENEEQITAQARRLVLWLMAEANGHLETDLAEAICNRALEILGRQRRLEIIDPTPGVLASPEIHRVFIENPGVRL